MNRILASTLAVLVAILAFGQSEPDSVKVYFKVGQWKFDPSIGDNRASLDAFIERVRSAQEANILKNVTIRSYCSPEGTDGFNKRLTKERCDIVAELIEQRAGVNRNMINKIPVGVDWSELRRLVAETPEVPSRSKILQILDNTPIYVFDSNGRIIDGRKKQLMDLRGGRPYNWMIKNIFPELRNAVAISIYYRTDAASEDKNTIRNDSAPDTSPLISDPSLNNGEPGQSETENADNSATEDSKVSEEDSMIDNRQLADGHTPIYCLALKTNLLYDALLLPNLELEWLINRNWSVSLEGGAAWWNKLYNKTYRLAYGSPEVRYHIKPRADWHGMYVGAFAGGGFFDLCGKKKGFRGPFAMGGLSLGYMWPISHRLSLEAGIGVGYMYSRYKQYRPLDGHKVYERTRDLHFFGPLKAKLSLSWRFCDINKPGRSKKIVK